MTYIAGTDTESWHGGPPPGLRSTAHAKQSGFDDVSRGNALSWAGRLGTSSSNDSADGLLQGVDDYYSQHCHAVRNGGGGQITDGESLERKKTHAVPAHHQNAHRSFAALASSPCRPTTWQAICDRKLDRPAICTLRRPPLRLSRREARPMRTSHRLFSCC